MHKKNWKKEKLGNLCDLRYGKNLPVKAMKDNGYPVFGANGIIGYYDRFLYKNSQVLISCRGANSGKINMSPENSFITNNSLICKIKEHFDIVPKFLYYRLSELEKTRLVTGTAQPQVTIRNAAALTLDYPYKKEQKLIVQKIETQFTRLDSAIKSLMLVKKRLGIYKKSILKAAFEGKLVDNFGYKIKKLGDLKRKGGGTPNTKVKKYWGGKINWITSASIDENNKIHFDKKITELGLKNSATNLVPKGSVIIVTRVGLGKVAVNEEATAFSQDSQGIICEGINPYFLMWQIKNAANEIISKGQGTTINGITVNKLNSIKVKMPESEIQNKIVNQIESRFSIIDNLEKSVNSSLKKAYQLKRLILNSAFEGKLVNYKDGKNG